MHAGLYLPVLTYFFEPALENHRQLSRHFLGNFSGIFSFHSSQFRPFFMCVCALMKPVCVYTLLHLIIYVPIMFS